MTFQRRRGDPVTFLWNLQSTPLPTVHNKAVLELRHLKTNKSWCGANTEVVTTRLPLHDWIWIWLFGYITFFSLWTFTKLEKETDVLVKLLFKNNSHVIISENSNWDHIVFSQIMPPTCQVFLWDALFNVKSDKHLFHILYSIRTVFKETIISLHFCILDQNEMVPGTSCRLIFRHLRETSISTF